jgi:DNA polymerase III alpha subunit
VGTGSVISPSISQPDYAELHCLTNFTFLRGASHAEELVMRAHELGYRALAITDECSIAGVVRAHAAAGVVVTRQRPGSANGVTFVTVEDETGSANIIVCKAIGECYRGPLVNSTLLEVEGTLQREGNVEHLVIHVIASRLFDRSRLLGELVTPPRNYH